MSSSCGLATGGHLHGGALSDRSGVVFDDGCVVVNAGIALGRRLGIESLIDAAVRLGGRPRLRPGGRPRLRPGGNVAV